MQKMSDRHVLPEKLNGLKFNFKFGCQQLKLLGEFNFV
jgi:hypothetical protein